MIKKVLSIAGSDSSGGAGIQADISTINRLGGVAMTAITAVTSQDENQVHSVHYIPIEHIKSQIEVTLRGANSIKTGMLCNKEVIGVISNILSGNVPIVIDPVMVSTSGYRLLEEDAVHAIKYLLLPKASLITPNIIEAELLTDSKITNTQDMIKVGQQILLYGAPAVLMKGGHLVKESKISDILVTRDDYYIFSHDYIDTENTHGTGCKLSSAIAYYLAQDCSLYQSVKNSIEYLNKTMRGII